jgi:hypothetical protein
VSLTTEARLEEPDAIYEALIALHQDMTPEQSALLNARLILILANHIGDAAVLREAFRLARAGIDPS